MRAADDKSGVVPQRAGDLRVSGRNPVIAERALTAKSREIQRRRTGNADACGLDPSLSHGPRQRAVLRVDVPVLLDRPRQSFLGRQAYRIQPDASELAIGP